MRRTADKSNTVLVSTMPIRIIQNLKQMKVKYIIPFLLIVMITTMACDDDDSGIPEIVSTDYFPLNIGDSWEFNGHT